MIQRRIHATAQTDLSLYVAYTHAPLPLWLVAVSRFSGSAVSKVIKKKDWFRSLRWTFTHASLPLGLLDFSRFSGLAVSEVIKKKNKKTKKKKKPFANGCKSAKNQLRSVKMLFGLGLICDTLAWHFGVNRYCVTTSCLTFGPTMRVFIVFSNYCNVLINKLSRRFYFCLTVFLV